MGGQQRAAVNHLSAADDNQSSVDNTETLEEPIDKEWRVIHENLQVRVYVYSACCESK